MSSILIIEDDASIAALLGFMVEREGHRAEILVDGAAAQRHIVTAAPPDLVLLDAMLPYRDGLTLLADMRALEPWRNIPVIMLTAKSLERDIVRALEIGASDYVLKPFQPQELMARMRRLLVAGTVR